MPVINITVKDKVASSNTKAIVNGNSDYAINWALDDEWTSYDTKTMRVRFFDGSVIDSIFSGTSCSLPVITETCMIEIGLFAGDLITSTPAVINCIRCIRDDEGPVQDPSPSIYDQILAKLNELGGVSPDDVAQAVADYMTDNPVKETDPTVPDWAKSPKKPKYTAEEVGALSADDLVPLTGTTSEVTPSQVSQAIFAGTPVVVNYTDGTYGALAFTNFNIAENFDIIAAQTIVKNNEAYIFAELGGNISTNNWFFNTALLATVDIVPEYTSQLTNDSGFLTEHQDINGKQDKSTLEADVAAKGFTKNTGTYSMPTGGIPKTDLASAVQASLGRADTLTDAYINNLINTALEVIENADY